LYRALDEDTEGEEDLPFSFQLDTLRSSFPTGFLLPRENGQFLPETSPLTAPWKTMLCPERVGGFKRRRKVQFCLGWM